jgi:hypothetical protein
MERYLEALEEIGTDAEVNVYIVEQSIHSYRWRIREYRARLLVGGITGFIAFTLWLHVGWAESNRWALLVWLLFTVWLWRLLRQYEDTW